MGFSRQEYWSVLPCPSSGDLPNAGIKPASPVFPALLAGATEPPGKHSSQRQVAESPSIKTLSRHGNKNSKQAKIMTQISARTWLNGSSGGNASLGGGWVVNSFLDIFLYVAA